MKKLSLLALVILTGCASQPAPNYVNGNHYLAGDEKCATHYGVDAYDRIVCADKDGVRTGEYRMPMSDIQVQAWYSKQNQSTTSYPSSVNCKQLGAFLNAEIKTFSGGVCPIGWVKA